MFTLWMVLLLQAAAGASPEAATDQLDARFVADLHDKKMADMLTLYTADAVFVNPDGSEATGQGLRTLYEQVTKAFDSDLHLKRVSLKHSLNTVIEEGSYTEELGHRDTGKVEQVSGSYRFSLRREKDGQWRYARMEWH